jgi:hypothetical protein
VINLVPVSLVGTSHVGPILGRYRPKHSLFNRNSVTNLGDRTTRQANRLPKYDRRHIVYALFTI